MRFSQEAYRLMNMAFDLSGIIILLLIVYSMLQKPFGDKKKSGFLIAILLHIFAMFMMVADVAYEIADRVSDSKGYMIVALLLVVISMLIVIALILSDSEGKIHFKHRTEPVSLSMVSFLIFPVLFAFIIENITRNIRILGISYAVSLYLIYVYLKEKQDKMLKEKETAVNATQAKIYAQQMKPHFIFNSLMSIESLVRTDPDKAEECIENLSGYLRGNIDALMSDNKIPFTVELSHIREYASLELADPDRQFEIVYELEVTDFSIPALTIQPIVENAIKHGALTHKDGTGKVVFRTEKHGEVIRITVEDNGTGDVREEGLKEHESVGMKSAENRIITQCGGSFHFEKGENGARTVILIPRVL